jgi:hypothetical protein
MRGTVAGDNVWLLLVTRCGALENVKVRALIVFTVKCSPERAFIAASPFEVFATGRTMLSSWEFRFLGLWTGLELIRCCVVEERTKLRYLQQLTVVVLKSCGWGYPSDAIDRDPLVTVLVGRVK